MPATRAWLAGHPTRPPPRNARHGQVSLEGRVLEGTIGGGEESPEPVVVKQPQFTRGKEPT